jgi:maleylpyruvate isomerase
MTNIKRAMMTNIKLYGFWRSTATWRVRIALAHKRIDYSYQPVHLRKGAGEQNSDSYRSLNPMRQVPLLEFVEDGRVERIAQSMAILEYLEERVPEPALLPQAPLKRALVRQLAEIVNSGIQPLQNTSVQLWVRDVLGADDQEWNRHWVERGLTALEALMAESAGRFAVGDALSFADLFLVPQLYFARRMGLALEPFPTLLRVEAACVGLPAFVDAHADRQPDAELQSG